MAATLPGQMLSSSVKELIQRQETYIEQLEKEAVFCRDKLSNILLQVKQVKGRNDENAEKLGSRSEVKRTVPG